MSYNFPEEENKILKFWEDKKIFQKLREKNAKSKKRWSFLDGPITANNPMGVHHAWGRTYKDLLQRYFAMKGFDERYQNGFDCQGLWVEVEVEKELGFKTKKDIEVYGIAKFVQKCKERVLKYSAIQTAQSVRLGQWMDWEHSYFTMSDENNYAIWHFLKKCHALGYLYKGRDSVPWCPRCGTAISQHEILSEDHKEITHDSVYFKLPIISPSSRKATEGQTNKNEFLLVWTTTPWTLPANIAVAVDEKIDYALVEINGSGKPEHSTELSARPSTLKNKVLRFWVAKELVKNIFKGAHKIVKTVKGEKLVGLTYSFAFDNLPRVKEISGNKKFHTVVATDDRIMPINMQDGTGLVHTAVSAGQEDFQLGKKLELPLIEIIGEDASYLDGLGEFSGQNAKKNPKIILDYLTAQDNPAFAQGSGAAKWIFEILPYQHRYPTCWRCKTELVWRVVDEWYISMDKLRKPLEDIVKSIQWIPAFGLERELDWIKNMHDWLISKKRYWGLALPIYECECGHFEVIGSKEELKKRVVEGWDAFEGNTPHRPWVDYVKIKCPGRKATEDPRMPASRHRDKKCNGIMSRIKDVGTPWLDAGVVPFSTLNYFGDKPYWKKWFPAQMVCESFPGQFKNWFYSLLVMSAVLEETAPVKTIFGYASVVDEKGEEMHKSKGNAIWFDDAVQKVGADPIRWLYAKANPAENVRFGYNIIEEVKRKLLTLQNVYTFFTTYVPKKDFPNIAKIKPDHILDKWIVSKMNHLIKVAEFNLDGYNMQKATAAMEDFFINDLSLWYVRRSRKRFNEDSPDRAKAVETLYYVLSQSAKIMAPVMPFFAEQMYQSLRSNLEVKSQNSKLDMPESVHLCDWPADQKDGQTDLELEQHMDEARSIVTLALAERAKLGIKVRQPLASLSIKNTKSSIKDNPELLDLIKEEVNIKEILFNAKVPNEVELDTKLTQALEEEGIIRDIIRVIQDQRKEQGLKPEDKISVILSVDKKIKVILEKNKEFLSKEIRAKTLAVQDEQDKTVLAKGAPENYIYSISIKK